MVWSFRFAVLSLVFACLLACLPAISCRDLGRVGCQSILHLTCCVASSLSLLYNCGVRLCDVDGRQEDWVGHGEM